MVGQCCCAASLFLRQRLANLKTFRQFTEQGGTFPGQHPSFAVGCYGGWTPASQCLMLVRMASRPRWLWNWRCPPRSTSACNVLRRPPTWRPVHRSLGEVGSFTWPEAMPGKHGLGAVGEFVRERFRDGGAKIIARLMVKSPARHSLGEDRRMRQARYRVPYFVCPVAFWPAVLKVTETGSSGTPSSLRKVS